MLSLLVMQVIGAVAVRLMQKVYDLAPPQPPPLISALFLMQSSCVSPVELTDGGGGDGGGAKSYDGDPL